MAIPRHFSEGEWYHCYNRGIDKRDVFDDEHDARRFLMLLYLANGTKPITLFSQRKIDVDQNMHADRGKPIVSIGAYCLLQNHFHLLVKETQNAGITTFMRRLGTAYAMYFNSKNERVGNLFLKPFRSRHVGTDRYFQKVLQYIHCNPVELYEPGWKSGKVRNMRTLEQKLIDYPYSSLLDFTKRSVVSPILGADAFKIANHPNISRMLEETREYYAEVGNLDTMR